MQLPAVPTSFSKVTDLMLCGRSCISHEPISLHIAGTSTTCDLKGYEYMQDGQILGMVLVEQGEQDMITRLQACHC